MSLTLSVISSLPKPAAKKLLQRAVATTNLQAQCLAVLVDDQGDVLGKVAGLSAYKSRIDALIEVSDFEGKVGETVADFALDADSKKTPLQLLLVGVGDTKKLNPTNLQKVANAIYKQAQKRLEAIYIVTGEVLETEQVQQFGLALLNASYRFDKYKAKPTDVKLTEITLISTAIKQEAIDQITAVHQGQNLCRDMANEPGNVCYPAYLAEQAQQMAAQYPDLLKVTVLGEAQMNELGMECFLSVSRGSEREGQLVLLEYQGKSKFSVDALASYDDVKTQLEKNKTPKDAPIVLVGKGVTFDSGGISIKPGAAMDEMKFDMGGAASVIGTMKALCEARLPINVVGALACAENMPSGVATRPGDIVNAMNGATVEILNTDAEGRLVLCDTLSYVQRYQPSALIDVATLTGAAIIALGHVHSAVYSKDEDVLFELQNASKQTGDTIWHMPLDDAYQTQIDSSIADIQNIGGRPAGSITAACFLSRFVEDDQPWAHLDIAGTAWISGKDKAATGRPVPLFMQYLANMAQQ